MLKEKLDSAFAFLQTKAPPLIGVDISSSALKMVELAEAGKRRLSARALRHRAAAQGRGQRRQHHQPRPGERSAAPRAQAPRHAQPQRRHGAADGDGDHQEDHRPGRPERGRARAPGRDRGQPVHPVRARRGQPRFPDPRTGAQQPRGGRSPDRRLAQGKGRGPRRHRRSRRAQAAGHGRRVLRDRGSVRA